MRKWFRHAALVFLLLVAAAAAVIYIGSERIFGKTYTFAASVPAAAGDAERGKHWAAILGCTDCHDATLHGNVIGEESFWIGRLVAPNLTVQRKLYDDAALVRVIRHGVKRDGHGVDLMPSNVFYQADDQTVADLIAFIRAAPDAARDLPEKTYGPVARWNFLTGEWQATPEQYDHAAGPVVPASHADGRNFGQYIAVLGCGECHGLDQKGDPNGGVPNLAVAKAYSLEEFTELMRHGVAKGQRHIRPMMSAAAKRRFAVMTDDEIAALKDYLDTRAP